MTSSKFSVVDYVLFAIALTISLLIGVYHAYHGKSGTEHFLLGGRSLPLLPTALSLLTSFISGISLLSYPAEIYTMGATFIWSLPGACLALAFTSVFIIPVMHRLKYVNYYKYFEDRFDSVFLRYYTTLLFIASTIFYLGAVLFAPCIALAGVTEVPVWVYISITGIVCTVYTTLGGIKAVIWTDTFQALIMYIGVITLLVMGVSQTGSDKIWKIAKSGGRLRGFRNISPDPFQYMTVWTGIFGGMFYWIGAFGGNQMALQRYCSLPTVKRAKGVAILTIPGISLVFLLVFTIGFVMFAYYAFCDPLVWNSMKKDQLVVYFLLEVIHGTYGLPGLFIAAVFSGTLSSISSGINSLAAVTWNDFLAPRIYQPSEKTATMCVKLLSGIFGAVIIGITFTVEPLGGVLPTILSCLGALAGPSVGLLILGLLVPWADVYGAYAGGFCATIFNLLVFSGRAIFKPDKVYRLPTLTSCCTTNTSICNITSISDEISHLYFEAMPKTGIQKLYSLSSLMLPFFGAMIVVVLGALVSWVTSKGGKTVKTTTCELIYWNIKSSLDNELVNAIELDAEQKQQLAQEYDDVTTGM